MHRHTSLVTRTVGRQSWPVDRRWGSACPCNRSGGKMTAEGEVKRILRGFYALETILLQERVVRNFTKCLDNGLIRDKRRSLVCLNTFVQTFPTGKERGRFLALDLGGTNFRSMLMEIDDKGEVKTSEQGQQVPQDIREGPGPQLFEFMAQKTKEFLEKAGESEAAKNVWPTVLTFSFPVIQTDIDKGIIKMFSKGYNCSEVIGKDVGQLLVEAAQKEGIQMDLKALINDTVGTFIAAKWSRPDTTAGIIVGTGTNAAYREEVERVPGYRGQIGLEHVLINTEWGAFGDEGELMEVITPYDKTLDRRSNNPQEHTFEKMVSGKYLGEIVRLALWDLAEKEVLNSKIRSALRVPDSFQTADISAVEKMNRDASELVSLLLEDKCACGVAQAVCCHVTARAALLFSIACTCLAHRIGQEEQTFAIDGSVYKHLSSFREAVPKHVKKLLKPPVKKIMFELIDGGSIMGAGFLAAALSAQSGSRGTCQKKENEETSR